MTTLLTALAPFLLFAFLAYGILLVIPKGD